MKTGLQEIWQLILQYVRIEREREEVHRTSRRYVPARNSSNNEKQECEYFFTLLYLSFLWLSGTISFNDFHLLLLHMKNSHIF